MTQVPAPDARVRNVEGWGRFPAITASIVTPGSASECAESVRTGTNMIARGLGRSYGDSGLASLVLDMNRLNRVSLDAASGVAQCEAGASLEDVLRVAIPAGWFLTVSPGTRFVTIGGAIAGDVHGKNHHVDGGFCRSVRSIDLLLGNGDVVNTTRDHLADLFWCTCGGMGLTGVIMGAEIQLRRISSAWITERSMRVRNLEELVELFDEHGSTTYSVAWIDSLARGDKLGRSVLMLGEHSDRGSCQFRTGAELVVPFEMPWWLLSRPVVATFNALYIRAVPQEGRMREVFYDRFFYPLDRLRSWNRLYGRQGPLQYQFVIPRSVGIDGLRKVFAEIVKSGRGSFLGVLKVLGEASPSPLSFPISGYTLALDFQIDDGVLALCERLDEIVLDLGGRLYLCKDARMSSAMFRRSYPRWEFFEKVREQFQATGKFASLQSRRLGLG